MTKTEFRDIRDHFLTLGGESAISKFGTEKFSEFYTEFTNPVKEKKRRGRYLKNMKTLQSKIAEREKALAELRKAPRKP